jgi:hypothetical protein
MGASGYNATFNDARIHIGDHSVVVAVTCYSAAPSGCSVSFWQTALNTPNECCTAHDRWFLRHLSNRVFEIDRGSLRVYEGGYGEYLAHMA